VSGVQEKNAIPASSLGFEKRSDGCGKKAAGRAFSTAGVGVGKLKGGNPRGRLGAAASSERSSYYRTSIRLTKPGPWEKKVAPFEDRLTTGKGSAADWWGVVYFKKSTCLKNNGRSVSRRGHFPVSNLGGKHGVGFG